MNLLTVSLNRKTTTSEEKEGPNAATGLHALTDGSTRVLFQHITGYLASGLGLSRWRTT